MHKKREIKNVETEYGIKVIHVEKSTFLLKKQLYTKLYTLSTWITFFSMGIKWVRKKHLFCK